jgi:Ca2+-binding EF-hand superfamily protein
VQQCACVQLCVSATYAEGLFNLIDTDGDGTVSCKEMCDEIKLFRASKTPGSKFRG